MLSKVVILILILLIVVPSVYAYPAEDENNLPDWATEQCLLTVYKIIQHESGLTNSTEIFSYMTTQIVADIQSLGCNNLTQWRWKIGYFPEYKIDNEVRISVLKQILYPKEFPLCKFTGQPADVKVWKSYGYNTTIGYSHTVNSLTVVGVDCK